ncbi:heat repeat-containing protein [Cystoisospora suis]|uniref:Heat repeat-containing protein n=1 Tax=Cystoisospora suis TaxID=483139 RepID=A0A2C6L7V6_9APIC|nr:heat repeat-containing protein [Cystoisospora suis]
MADSCSSGSDAAPSASSQDSRSSPRLKPRMLSSSTQATDGCCGVSLEFRRDSHHKGGLKHACCSPSPPPKKRLITPKARPKKLHEIMKQRSHESCSGPGSGEGAGGTERPSSYVFGKVSRGVADSELFHSTSLCSEDGLVSCSPVGGLSPLDGITTTSPKPSNTSNQLVARDTATEAYRHTSNSHGTAVSLPATSPGSVRPCGDSAACGRRRCEESEAGGRGDSSRSLSFAPSSPSPSVRQSSLNTQRFRTQTGFSGKEDRPTDQPVTPFPSTSTATEMLSDVTSSVTSVNASGCPTPAARMSANENDKLQRGPDADFRHAGDENEGLVQTDSISCLDLSPSESPFSRSRSVHVSSSTCPSTGVCPSPLGQGKDSGLPVPQDETTLVRELKQQEETCSTFVGRGATERIQGELSPEKSAPKSEDDEALSRIPLNTRLASKVTKQRLHGCDELLQMASKNPEGFHAVFDSYLSQGTIEKLLRDSSALVQAKVVDVLLAFSKAATRSAEGKQTGPARSFLSADQAVRLLQVISPAALQNVLPNSRTALPCSELLALLSSVHSSALSTTLSAIFSSNEKLLAEKKGNIALLKGPGLRQLGASLQLLQQLLEDFGAAAINASGGLKDLLEKGLGPFCCCSDKSVRAVSAAAAAHAVWVAGSTEAARKLAGDAVKQSKAMQNDITSLVNDFAEGRKNPPEPRRQFLTGPKARLPGASEENTCSQGQRRGKLGGQDGAESPASTVVLGDETDVLKIVCQQSNWVMRATEGQEKKLGGSAGQEADELPWKVKMQAWQQLEEALLECVRINKKNAFVPSLLNLIHRSIKLEPTLPVVSCCLRVLQHLVRHLLSEHTMDHSNTQTCYQNQVRALLADTASKLKVNNRQVQMAAAGCLQAFLSHLPLDVACADLLPMKEKLANYRQAVLEGLAAAILKNEQEIGGGSERADSGAFLRAVPELLDAAKAGSDDGAPGVRTAALHLLAVIGQHRLTGREVIEPVLQQLQEQKKKQVLKIIAARQEGKTASIGKPSIEDLVKTSQRGRQRGSGQRADRAALASLDSVSSVASATRSEVPVAPVKAIAGGSWKAKGLPVSRVAGSGFNERNQAGFGEGEGCAMANSGRTKRAGSSTQPGRHNRSREGTGESSAVRSQHCTPGEQSVTTQGRSPQAASPFQPSASQNNSAPTSFSSSPWAVPECALSAEEAGEAARKFFPTSILQGLSSLSGTERKDACGRAARWWAETCRCSECCKEEAGTDENATGVLRTDDCLDRVRLSYAPHLLLFMRTKLHGFREKSLLVQDSVVACLTAVVEGLRRITEKAKVSKAAFDHVGDSTGGSHTGVAPDPCLASLLLDPLVEKLGEPRLGERIQSLCHSLAELLRSPLPVASVLIRAIEEGSGSTHAPVRGTCNLHVQQSGKCSSNTQMGNAGTPSSSQKAGVSGFAAAGGDSSKPRGTPLGGGRASHAVCGVLEKLVQTWGAASFGPAPRALVVLARQMIDAHKVNAAQASRSSAMRLLAVLQQHLGEKTIYAMLVGQPLAEDLKEAVRQLASLGSSQASHDHPARSSGTRRQAAVSTSGTPAAPPSSSWSPSRSPSLSSSSVAASISALAAGASAYRAAVSMATCMDGDSGSPRKGLSPSLSFEGAAAGEFPLDAPFEAGSSSRERVSIAPFLTPELMADLQPKQASRNSVTQGDEVAVAALRKVMFIIATKAHGCVKAEGLSVFVPALRLRILDKRPIVTREALFLAAALCDALTTVPSSSSSECPLADNATPRRRSAGVQLYQDLLVPAVLVRLGHYDQKVVEAAHIAALKWLRAIEPDAGLLLITGVLERRSQAEKKGSTTAETSSGSPRSFPSLSFAGDGMNADLRSVVMGGREAVRSADFLISLLVASEHSFDRCSKDVLRNRFVPLLSELSAVTRGDHLSNHNGCAGVLLAVEALISRVSKYVEPEKTMPHMHQGRERAGQPTVTELSETEANESNYDKGQSDAHTQDEDGRDGKECMSKTNTVAEGENEEVVRCWRIRSRKNGDSTLPDCLDVEMTDALGPSDPDSAQRNQAKFSKEPCCAGKAAESSSDTGDIDEEFLSRHILCARLPRRTKRGADGVSGSEACSSASAITQSMSPSFSRCPPRGGPVSLSSVRKNGAKTAGLARDELVNGWKYLVSPHLLSLMFPCSSTSSAMKSAPKTSPRSRGATNEQGKSRDIAHLEQAADIWCRFFSQAFDEGENKEAKRKVVRETLKGEEEDVPRLLVGWIAVQVSDSSGYFPHGFSAPLSASPSNPRPRAEYLSGKSHASVALCSASSYSAECTYTVAPPLVLLAVFLQTLRVLNLRLTPPDQQDITALLLELRSASALNEMIQGRGPSQSHLGTVLGGLRCEGLQQAHRQALREILLLVPGVAAEPGKLIGVLQKQIARTKNRNFLCDMLETLSEVLEHHLASPSPLPVSTLGMNFQVGAQGSAPLGGLTVHAGGALLSEFLLTQLVPRLLQLLALTGGSGASPERSSAGRGCFKETILRALGLCNTISKGGVLSISSPALTADVRARLCESTRVSGSSSFSKTLLFPVPPRPRCSDYTVSYAAAPPSPPSSTPEGKTNSSRLEGAPTLGDSENSAESDISQRKEGNSRASTGSLKDPSSGGNTTIMSDPTEKDCKRSAAKPSVVAHLSQESAKKVEEVEIKHFSQSVDGSWQSPGFPLAQKPAEGKNEDKRDDAQTAKGQITSSIEVLETREEERPRFADANLQKLMWARREELEEMAKAMKGTNTHVESLRSGHLFSSLLSKVDEATAASETLLSSLQREHAEQHGLAWAWPTTMSAVTQKARGDSTEWLSVKGWLLLNTRQEHGRGSPASHSMGTQSRQARSLFTEPYGEAAADDVSKRELTFSSASMLKLWCSELSVKDNIARVARAAHCLVYLLTNAPLDHATARGFFQPLLEWKGRAGLSFLFSEQEEGSGHELEDSNQKLLESGGGAVAPSWEKEFGLNTRFGVLEACSKTGKLPQLGLSLEGEEILLGGYPLCVPMLLESLLQGLDTVFQLQNFEDSTQVAGVSFHTMISLLLLVEVLLRRFVSPATSLHAAGDAPSESRPSISETKRSGDGMGDADRGGRRSEQLLRNNNSAGKKQEGRSDIKDQIDWIQQSTLAKTCKQLLLCMSRYQAFVYKAATPGAEDLLLPRLITTALLNQCLGKNMLRGSFRSLVGLVEFVYTLASQQIQGVLPDLNSDTMWRFLSKIHKRVVAKFQEASAGTGEPGGCSRSGTRLLAEELHAKRPQHPGENTHGLSAETRTRISALFPREELLQFVHTVLSSWHLVEGAHASARIGLQQRRQSSTTHNLEDMSSIVAAIEKLHAFSLVHFRLLVQTILVYCPDTLGAYLKARGWDSTSRVGQKLDRVLSPPHAAAGKKDVLASAESSVKGSVEAREALRGFNCTACIGWTRGLGNGNASETDTAISSKLAEQSRILVEKEKDANGPLTHSQIENAVSTKDEECEGPESSRGQQRREGTLPGYFLGAEDAGSSPVESDMKDTVASLIEAEHAKLSEVMPLHSIGSNELASDNMPPRVVGVHPFDTLRPGRSRDIFRLVDQQPFDTWEDLSLNSYLNSVRACLCKAQLAAVRERQSQASPGHSRTGQQCSSTQACRGSPALSFLWRSVILLSAQPTLQTSRRGAEQPGTRTAHGVSAEEPFRLADVDAVSGNNLRGSSRTVRFPTGRKWVDLDAVSRIFKVEMQLGRAASQRHSNTARDCGDRPDCQSKLSSSTTVSVPKETAKDVELTSESEAEGRSALVAGAGSFEEGKRADPNSGITQTTECTEGSKSPNVSAIRENTASSAGWSVLPSLRTRGLAEQQRGFQRNQTQRQRVEPGQGDHRRSDGLSASVSVDQGLSRVERATFRAAVCQPGANCQRASVQREPNVCRLQPVASAGARDRDTPRNEEGCLPEGTHGTATRDLPAKGHPSSNTESNQTSQLSAKPGHGYPVAGDSEPDESWSSARPAGARVMRFQEYSSAAVAVDTQVGEVNVREKANRVVAEGCKSETSLLRRVERSPMRLSSGDAVLDRTPDSYLPPSPPPVSGALRG